MAMVMDMVADSKDNRFINHTTLDQDLHATCSILHRFAPEKKNCYNSQNFPAHLNEEKEKKSKLPSKFLTYLCMYNIDNTKQGFF